MEFYTTYRFRGESPKVGQTWKVGQVINLRGNKFVQRVSCVVLNSICNINFHWIFLYTL